jgi:general secretion pathway protein H
MKSYSGLDHHKYLFCQSAAYQSLIIHHPSSIIKASPAFTLIELLVVLSLMTVVFGLAIPVYSRSLPGERLKAAAREIAGIVKHAGILARSEGTDKVLTIDMDAGSYWVDGIKTRILPSGVRIKVIDPFAGEQSKGRCEFSFQKEGGADGGTIIVYNGKKSITVDLDPIAGALVLYDEKSKEQ